MWDTERYSNNIAVIEENGNQVTYAELENYNKDLAAFIPKRCLVFNICTNNLGSLVGYLSFLKNKIVPLMISNDLDKGILIELINKYKPAYIYAPVGFEFPDQYEVVYSRLDYSLLKTGFSSDVELNDDLALLLSTSGSTGSPKLVKQSYLNIQANTKSIIEYLGITENDRSITTLPMSYTYGISVINTHIAAGASLILTNESVMQKKFWELVKTFEATSFAGVPYTYEMLDRLRFYAMKIPSLKSLTQAGGKLSPNLHLKFAQYANDNGLKFTVMYGQTEATARMSFLPSDESIRKHGSIGIAIPGGRFALVDDNNEEITTPDTVGELVYYGDNVTLGYANSLEDLSLGDERKGRLETGDLAKFDQDSYYFIVGRKKRFLKIFGNRMNLDEVEVLIKVEFNNISCAVDGKDDLMTIYIEDETHMDNVRIFITKKLAIAKAALKVVVVKEIAKNESGKILYAQLKEE